MSNDLLMQWLGFMGITLGAFFYIRRPMLGAMFSFLGAVFLAIWCAMQQPIPLGMLSVQLVCAGFSLMNFERANKKASTLGDGVD